LVCEGPRAPVILEQLHFEHSLKAFLIFKSLIKHAYQVKKRKKEWWGDREIVS
jgi:hypothetical protein